jgi:DNA mismatch repair protein MLH1
MKIIQLSPDVIKRIAAGEVVHRPSSAVKEILENSLDANSTHLTIEIENGGFSLIRISDNGSGISCDDLPLACQRHTTSKIRTFSDLREISSFGFRGEALFSISSISKVKIQSKIESCDLGYCVEYLMGESISKPVPIAFTNGTTVEVENIFYNQPNRLRSLPESASQIKKIIEIINKYSIVFPKISFLLKIDGKEKIRTTGNSDYMSVLSFIHGLTIHSSLFYFSSDLIDNASVELILSHSSNLQVPKLESVFINKRLVKYQKNI